MTVILKKDKKFLSLIEFRTGLGNEIF